MKRWPGRVRCRDRSAESACIESWYAQRSAGCPLRLARLNRGFTLTEVLIVAVVIGILLSFITAAGFSALTRAHEFAIQTEAGKLALAMDTFKAEYGSYPPANLALPVSGQPDRLFSFVSKHFPFYLQRLAADQDVAGGNLREKLRSDLGFSEAEGGKGIYIHGFDPSQALVFWLVGFSGDPADPFAGHRERMLGDDSSRSLYEFADRLGYDDTDDTLTVHYYPELWGNVSKHLIDEVAFLYLDHTSYDLPYTPSAGLPPFTAYATASAPFHPRSFQVINAGLDRKLGEGGMRRGGDDADNAAHFSGQLMGDRTESDGDS